MNKAEQILRSIDFNNNDKEYILSKLNEYNDFLIAEGCNEYSKAYLNNEEGRREVVDLYIEDCFWLDEEAIEEIKSNPNSLFELISNDDFEYRCEDDDYIQYFAPDGIITLTMEDAKEYLKSAL